MTTFKSYHQQTAPLLIANVWDVASAKTAKELGFTAIGTSSGAMATMLGYNDGEEISFEELEYLVKRITTTVNIPLSVDLEAGYSRDPQQIVAHIQLLARLGVKGINLEDSLVFGERKMVNATEFSDLIKQIKKGLLAQQMEIFLNIRTDTFLLNLPDALPETIERAQLYQSAGADGLFVPCIEQVSDIQQLVQQVDLPLNVMCMPNLPDFSTLQQLGVKRISMGNFAFNQMQQQLKKSYQDILHNRSFQSIFA
ncbi:MAG: isocitrate lyase/phosphoenolpyruvate mutase family protein [Saprospiraceae bacterium]